MGTDKNSLKKKVLDALKDELQTVSETENEQLTGGFSGSTADTIAPIDDINVPCNNKGCTSNTVAGCGA
jgi:hypothetical protein